MVWMRLPGQHSLPALVHQVGGEYEVREDDTRHGVQREPSPVDSLRALHAPYFPQPSRHRKRQLHSPIGSEDSVHQAAAQRGHSAVNLTHRTAK